jgi:hypothetical protein
LVLWGNSKLWAKPFSWAKPAYFDFSLLGTIVDGRLQSPVVLCTWPCKMFFTSKLNYLLFCNPTYKRKTAKANRWGTTNSKPPGLIIMMGQSETVFRVRSYLLHSFMQVHNSVAPFSSHCAIMRSQNHFPEPNLHILNFLHAILLCRITYCSKVKYPHNTRYQPS